MRSSLIFVAQVLLLLFMACTSAKGESVPALLLPDDKKSYDLLRQAITESVRGMRISSIAGDPTTTSRLVASPREPNQYEMNSIFRPVTFELRIRGKNCYLVNENDQFEVDLPGLKCKPA